MEILWGATVCLLVINFFFYAHLEKPGISSGG